ncbi:CBS domain-containing protein [Candidatus Margulisiibacteriota bacterium]
MKGNFKLITIMGIPVEINVTWLIIFCLVLLSLSKGYFPAQTPQLSSLIHWSMGLISALMLFVCLLLHELSHSVVAIKNKLPIAGITLFVFGGVAHMKKEPANPATEFKMAAAGPIMSVFLAIIFLLVKTFAVNLNLSIIIIAISNYLFIINLAVAVFNMVPGFPLDGGRLLRATLWYYLKDLKKATQVAAGIGKTFALGLMALGVFTFMSGNYIGGIWFIFIGIFLQEAAEMSYRQMLMKKVFSKFHVEDLMSENVVYIPSDESIDNVINNYYFRYRHHVFPIIENGNIVGLLNFHDIKETPKTEWKKKRAKEVMAPFTNNHYIHPNASLDDALALMASNGIGRLLVMEKSNHQNLPGQVVGILSQKDILGLFKMKNDLG